MTVYVACTISGGIVATIKSGPLTLAGPVRKITGRPDTPNWQQDPGRYAVVTAIADPTDAAAVTAWIAGNASNAFIAGGVYVSDANGNPA
jgi:hypothetical protein